MIPRNSNITWTPEQASIIEKQNGSIKEDPTVEEIYLLQKLLNQEKTCEEIANFIKQKFGKKVKEQCNPLLTPVSDHRGSMFKQFSDVPPSKPYICKSKRKIKPTLPVIKRSLQQTVNFLDTNFHECIPIVEKKGKKMGSASGFVSQSCHHAFYDLFYSSLDRNYFREEPFRKLINQIDSGPDQRTYNIQRMIRQALPIPRLFNSEFVSGELDKLAESRAQTRAIPRQKGRDTDLAVGKQVIAMHPACGHLHTASVLAIYKDSQYMIKFQKFQLGTQKVVDFLMAPRQMTSHQRVVIQNVDYEVMALAIRLLEYKTELIKLFREYNIRAQKLIQNNITLDNLFFQEYGWLGSTINILSLGIRHVISRFRIRGLSSSNMQRVGQHLGAFMVNPLRPFEGMLSKSSQSSDKYAKQQIQNMISNHKDIRTQNTIKQLSTKYGVELANNKQMDIKHKEEMQRIFKCMIGVLVNLRYQSRHFSMQDNKYLCELMSIIDTKYPEHLNQIYQTLHAITGRVAQEAK